MALSARARAATARTRAALASPPVVYVPEESCDRPAAQPREMPAAAAKDVTQLVTLTIDQVVALHVDQVMAECSGNISEAARRLGVARSSLQRRLRRTERDLADG